MIRIHTAWTRITGSAAAAALVLLASSCARFEASGLPGSAASMAHNQIMLVAAEPETFGHYRLTALMRDYPDLDLFMAKRGMPDFLAETSNDRQHYFILYYPTARQAFAARTRPGQRQRLEFAGPYPITDSEKRTLEDLRKKETSRSLHRGLDDDR
ncbi:MAG: hypothetical protein EHM17_07655 [Verrucomicrobiaceae bacterium]|nr:MAG: hypothetical protein EHM17_07655 [Verrucomicrobiaceae bacterium]